jgi:hypothetical protein
MRTSGSIVELWKGPAIGISRPTLPNWEGRGPNHVMAGAPGWLAATLRFSHSTCASSGLGVFAVPSTAVTPRF